MRTAQRAVSTEFGTNLPQSIFRSDPSYDYMINAGSSFGSTFIVPDSFCIIMFKKGPRGEMPIVLRHPALA